MQQFLIPSQNGPSQIINIPVSLLSQANQQPISFITSTGQIFQLPSFYNPNAAQSGGTAGSGGNNAANASNNNTANNAVTAASSSSTASTTTGQTTTATAQAGQTLVINHQGQLISLPVLQQQQQQQFTTTGGNQSGAGSSVVNLTNAQFHHVPTQVVTTATTSRGSGGAAAAAAAAAAANGTTPIKTLLEDDDKEQDDQGPTIASMPQGMSQMPGQITHGTTVDGVNLDEIREFAKAFKLRRLALGLTQTQVGQALSATKGPAYSQSAICRFEKLDITPKSAAKIKPVLEKWMQEAELKYADRLKSGSQHNFADLLGTENTKKRKRRTSFTPQALEILNEYFEKNSHPSADFNGNQGADMTMLAQKLNYDREVIRVWFCNKRQALKNSMKKMKQASEGNGVDLSSDNSNLSSPNTSLNASSGGGVTVTTTPTATINATLTHQQQQINAAQLQQQLVHQQHPQLHQVVVVQQPSQTQIQLPTQTTATTLVIAQAPQQVIEQQIVQHVSESEANKTVTNGSSSPVLIKSEATVGSVVEEQQQAPTENGTETTESTNVVSSEQEQPQMDTEEASEVANGNTVPTAEETAEETNNDQVAGVVVVEDSVSQVQSEQTESNNNNNNESDTNTTTISSTNVESTINTAESSNNTQVNA